MGVGAGTIPCCRQRSALKGPPLALHLFQTFCWRSLQTDKHTLGYKYVCVSLCVCVCVCVCVLLLWLSGCVRGWLTHGLNSSGSCGVPELQRVNKHFPPPLSSGQSQLCGGRHQTYFTQVFTGVCVCVCVCVCGLSPRPGRAAPEPAGPHVYSNKAPSRPAGEASPRSRCSLTRRLLYRWSGSPRQHTGIQDDEENSLTSDIFHTVPEKKIRSACEVSGFLSLLNVEIGEFNSAPKDAVASETRSIYYVRHEKGEHASMEGTWQRTSEDRLSRLRTFLSYHGSIEPSIWAISAVLSSIRLPLHSCHRNKE